MFLFAMYSALIIFTLVYVHFVEAVALNNVCSTFEDYFTDRDTNPNCRFNPDGDLSVVSYYYFSQLV